MGETTTTTGPMAHWSAVPAAARELDRVGALLALPGADRGALFPVYVEAREAYFRAVRGAVAAGQLGN